MHNNLVGHKYAEDHYPIPSEDDYYQRDPDAESDGLKEGLNGGDGGEEGRVMKKRRRSSFDDVMGAKKSKPML